MDLNKFLPTVKNERGDNQIWVDFAGERYAISHSVNEPKDNIPGKRDIVLFAELPEEPEEREEVKEPPAAKRKYTRKNK